MAIFTNASRNTSTFTNLSLGNYATWTDSTIAWADSSAEWDSFRGDTYTRVSRNTSTFANLTKN